jgi:hypothetical protein
MAVLVKPNGLLGTVYLEAIRPFRHLLVYPSMRQAIARDGGLRSGFDSQLRADLGR